ncbi:MAG: hypothetical protein M1820_006684 [Bogoriella megaspora]|nr:MAG: hypothetical protein M1820_006684 [Bogoriella megaspora]
MSRQSPEHRPKYTSADNGSQGVAMAAPRTREHPSSAITPSSQATAATEQPQRSLTLPPLHRTLGTTDESSEHPRSDRAFGVHSILNPPQSSIETPRGIIRKADELDPPSPSSDTAPRHPEPPISRVPSRASSSDVSPADSQHSYQAFSNGPRRVFSPRVRVPRLPANPNSLGTPTATLPVQENPFLASAGCGPNADSISVQPLLPTPPAVIRQSYGFPTAPTPPNGDSRRASLNMAGHTHSASASPSTQFSGYSQTSRTSPAIQLGLSGGQSRPSFFAGSSDTSSLPGEHGRVPGLPVSSTAHSSYQLMTFETTQGPVQVPVDVQAASRAADDKRKRNAGASARFRARRKEKEREAGQTISKLEHQIKMSKDEAEFYRRERDILAAALMRTPGGDKYFPRPPSPRQQGDQTSNESTGRSSGSYASPMHNQGQSGVPMKGEGPESACYPSTPEPAHATAGPRTNYQSAYPPIYDPNRQSGSAQRGTPANSHPLPMPAQQQFHQLQQHSGPPPPQPVHQHQNSFGPYRTEQYDRSWAPGTTQGSRVP